MNKFLLLLVLLISTSSFARGYGDRNIGRGGRGGGRGGREYRGHGNGHVRYPVRFNLGRAPYGGWRGYPYRWNDRPYYIWSWGPWAPYYGWGNYYGWHEGLYYYVPEGLRCIADNSQVGGEWSGMEAYYYSDDAIGSALGSCESDPAVQNANAQGSCRIRTCVRY